MKSFGTRYVVRHTRTAVMPAGFKHLPVIIKKAFTFIALIAVFGVSVNMLAKVVVEKIKAKAPAVKEVKMPAAQSRTKASLLSVFSADMFSNEKYIIEDGHEYIVRSNGKTSLVDSNIDGKYLVRLTGIAADEKREWHLKALKQALAIDKKYLAEASDINLRDPKRIMMTTTNGGTVLFGDSISQDKLENFLIAMDKLKETGKRFRTMNLTYKDMVIIK